MARWFGSNHSRRFFCTCIFQSAGSHVTEGTQVLGQFFHYRGEEGPLHLESHAHGLERHHSRNDIERMMRVPAYGD